MTKKTQKPVSDTPLTDGVVAEVNINGATIPVVMAYFARQLERENIKLREALIDAQRMYRLWYAPKTELDTFKTPYDSILSTNPSEGESK